MANKKRQRATEAEVAARVQEVLQARLGGASFHDLQNLAVEKGWAPISDRQLWRYVEAADARMAEHFAEDRENIFRRHVLQRRRLFALALQDGDTRTALAILRDEAELYQIYPPKRTELTGRNGGPLETVTATVELTDDDRRTAIANLFATVGKADPGQDPSGQSNAHGCAVGPSRTLDDPGGDDTGPMATGPDALPL
jgi:hypothetical protein